MVIKEFLSPINIIKDQNLCIYKLPKVILVYKDKTLIFVAF